MSIFETEHGDGKLLGHVTMFSLLNGSKKRNSIQIWEWEGCVNEKEEEAVGVLFIWYEVECNGETLTGALTPLKMATHGFSPVLNILS